MNAARRSAGDRRRRAIYLFTLFAAAITLLILWGQSQEQRVAARIAGSGGEAPRDAGLSIAELPEEPTRKQVGDVLRSLSPLVATCGGGESGVIRVHLTIAGKSGIVTEATVAKQFSGTDVARCATGIVSVAQFPRFRKRELTVAFPYTLPAYADAGVDGAASASDGG